MFGILNLNAKGRTILYQASSNFLLTKTQRPPIKGHDRILQLRFPKKMRYIYVNTLGGNMPEIIGGLGLIFLMFLGIALLTVAWKTIKIVPQSSVLLIERLGKFHRVATSGLNIIVPFFESPRAVYWSNVRPGTTSIDLREQYIDMPHQPVITRDNVTINVDSVVYWQITDPTKSVYEVADLVGAIVQLTITGMRSVMGDMDLDHTLSNRDQINGKLRMILDEATDKWGVKVTRVDVKNINPPEDVRITMEKQMTAERNRRALILTAEGDKQAAITRAEGEKQAAVTRSEGNKQSAILDAEGAAQARLTAANAEAQAIGNLAKAIGSAEQTAQYLITSRYVDSLRDMTRTQNSKVIFMPMETSTMLSSIGAIKEVLAETGEKSEELPASPRSPRELNK
ncbi:SPFH domain-containing protein [soil metagenome]